MTGGATSAPPVCPEAEDSGQTIPSQLDQNFALMPSVKYRPMSS
jgi:hypothetical protein